LTVARPIAEPSRNASLDLPQRGTRLIDPRIASTTWAFEEEAHGFTDDAHNADIVITAAARYAAAAKFE